MEELTNKVTEREVSRMESRMEEMLDKRSNKGIEPDMACSMIQRLDNDGYTVGTLHADNGATTQSRLHRICVYNTESKECKIYKLRLVLDMQIALAKAVDEEIFEDMKASTYYSVMLDESTDRTTEKNFNIIQQNFFIIKTHSIAHRLPSESSQAANSINYLKKKQGSLNEKDMAHYLFETIGTAVVFCEHQKPVRSLRSHRSSRSVSSRRSSYSGQIVMATLNVQLCYKNTKLKCTGVEVIWRRHQWFVLAQL
ncbi:unnamed protein product [Mytilus edulis]|uniref:DUF4371 domain-containing protein n=1 Tax=Mytilus edulis TaxID=6550 RepID=A0A8S3VB42_MYTED|nr:unnamed protein product [Mytilus edulis]